MALRLRLLGLINRRPDPFAGTPPGLSLSPSARHFADYDKAPLRLRYQPALDVVQWQREARARLIELTGYAQERAEPVIVSERKISQVDGIARRAVYIRAGSGVDIPVNLITPAGIGTAPFPVMICLQGTNSGAHLSWGEVRFPADIEKATQTHDIARQAASRGYLAVVIEQSCFGERMERQIRPRSQAACVDATMHALLLGRCLLGERCTDVSSVIDWLMAERQALNIDPARIHIMGHSAGGSTALFSAAMDERVAAVMASGCIGFVRDTIGRRRDDQGQNVIPGLLQWMEFDDVAGLIAPRPLLGVAGTADPIWPAAGAEAVMERVGAIYQQFGAGRNLRLLTFAGGHEFRPAENWAAFAALQQGAATG
jgi:dienelactone hydrolase